MRLFSIFLILSLSSCWMLRAYKVRKMRLTDPQKLPSITIAKSDQPFRFINAVNQGANEKLKIQLDSCLINTQTAAFLVIRNDSIIYDRYSMGFSENSLLPSQSMAKSFVSTLVGIAIDEHKIKSDLDPITNYLPELIKKDPRFANITIRHLLDMRSGFDFNEGSYNLKDDAVRLGFRPNLKKHIFLRAKIAEPPGNFKYQSINTMLLGIIIERATARKLQDYFEEKLWKPIGTEYEANWNVDSKKRKHLITSAGINATAVDFAKLGRLYIKKGKLENKQIISTAWIEGIANADTMDRYEGYKSQWWNRRVTQSLIDSVNAISLNERKGNSLVQQVRNSYQLPSPADAFSALGLLKQIIYVNPGKNLIIVRFGRGWPRSEMFVQFIYDLGEEL